MSTSSPRRTQQVRTAINAILTTFIADALATDGVQIALIPGRPLVPPADLPAVCTVMGDGQAEYPDWGSIRENKVFVVRLMIQAGDSDENEASLDDLGDLLEDNLDAGLRGGALRDLTETADRTGRRERILDYNGVLIPCHEFPIRARMRLRQLGPAQ